MIIQSGFEMANLTETWHKKKKDEKQKKKKTMNFHGNIFG